MPRGRPRKKKKPEQIEFPFEDQAKYDEQVKEESIPPVTLKDDLTEVEKPKTKRGRPKKTTNKSDWLYVVRRVTYPEQITRVLTHKSSSDYFKDPSTTKHSDLTCLELDTKLGGPNRDKYVEWGSLLFKEARDPDRLIEGIKGKTLETFKPYYDGLKGFSLVITEDQNMGTVIQMVITIAAKDGTFETQVTLNKNLR